MPALGREPLEAVEVELVRVELEDVTRSPGTEQPLREHLAQAGYVRLDDLRGAVRRPCTPELFDEAVDRYRPVRVEKQHGKERPLLLRPEREELLSFSGLEGPEDPKFHDASSGRNVARSHEVSETPLPAVDRRVTGALPPVEQGGL
jgi:hypothetical protein